jgi:hypothetical protein
LGNHSEKKLHFRVESAHLKKTSVHRQLIPPRFIPRFIKGGCDIQYGHKLNLSTGKSGLVLDVVVEAGNPADTDRLIPMLIARERQREYAVYGWELVRK